jgi:hypothetical protein
MPLPAGAGPQRAEYCGSEPREATVMALASPPSQHDIKVVQEQLGNSSRAIRPDTYTTMLPEVARAAAEATTALLPMDTTGTREPAARQNGH